jgi:hypothetical protein
VSARPGAGGREGRELLRELGECVAQAVAQVYARKQAPHVLGGAIKAIGEHPLNPVGRLMLERRALECLIGLGKSCRTRLLSIAYVPEYTAPDHRGQIHPISEAMAVLLLG